MRKNRRIFNFIAFTLVASILYFPPAFHQTVSADEVKLTDESSIDAVIGAMTLEEKVDLIGGAGASVEGAAGGTYEIPRLGIPKLTVADGPVGPRFGSSANKTTTGFPIPTALSSTFNEDLMYKVSSGMGKEALEYGIDVILGPGLNIQRDPRGGRNFEYYSEDPYLSGVMSSAFTKGIQDQGVGVSLKHFAANNQEENRSNINEIISERALREIYFPGFEMTVKEAKPWTVMTSYNAINGPHSSHNKWLLTDVLKNQWGFNGLVMSDWGGTKNDGVAMLKAGQDLAMSSLNATGKNDVKKAINNGSLSVDKLDTAVRNILELVVKSPTFNGKSVVDNAKKSVSLELAKVNAALSREAASEGMVLLTNNNNTLPLNKDVKEIGLVGNSYTMPSCGFGTPDSACTTDNAATKMFLMGAGSAYISAPYEVQLPEGLANAGYTPFYKNENGDEITEDLTEEEAAYMAKNTDIGVVVLARGSGEGTDANAESIDTSPKEIELIKKVSNAYHAENKKLVVILNIGTPLITEEWKDHADSILISWQPGMEAGNNIADVLSGKENPSGKLPETFPKRLEDVPSYDNFPNTGGDPSLVEYQEGIYVGYRHYDTNDVEPAYEFGYGQSYTEFDYSNIQLESPMFDLNNQEETITVSADVTNTGKVPGKEAAQLYIHDGHSKLDRPDQELKGFKKLSLQPGETKTATFTIDKRALSAYDDEVNEWVAEPGKFTVRVGSSSRDIKETGDFYAVEFTNTAGMQSLVDRFAKEGEFTDDDAVHALKLHLTAVEHFEKQEAAEKVVKHMEGFKLLIDHQEKNDLISEKAYKILKANTDYVIKKWQ